MTRARLGGALVALAMVVAVSGCATIPRSGPVSQSQGIRSGDTEFPSFDYLPSGPAAGASREAVLTGFIEAAVSPQQGYQVAREFLTPKFSSTWKPDAQVTIDTGTDRTPTVLDQNTLELRLTPLAFVDDVGGYRRAASSTPIVQPYRFAKVGGQWRIDRAPDGVVLDESQFGNVFSAHTLYFYSPAFRYLVPDQRWFPSRVSTPTRIVNALLEGPSPWLSGAVVSAFPQNTKLAADSVLVANGSAQVDFDSAADQATQLGLERMKLQLAQSLTNTSTIQSVRIAIQGEPRQIADDFRDAPVIHPVVDASPLVGSGGHIGFLSGDVVTPLPTFSDRLVALNPTSLSLSADRRTAVVLADGAVEVLRGQNAAVTVDTRDRLTPPTIDQDDTVWSVPRTRGSPLYLTRKSGGRTELPLPWSSATAVDQIAVSRDGTRLAGLIETGTGTHVVVSAILRSDSGEPVRLGDPFDLGPIGSGTGSGISLAWVDDVTLAVLSVAADGTTTVTRQVIGGESTTSDGPRDAVDVSGGTTESSVWIRTRAGGLLEPRGTGWQMRASGITLLGVQQGTPTG